jgi:two-component system response regulator RpfG
MGAIIALGHHEKYDGSGYPNGLHGEDIPIVARVVAVADVFDALVSERPYKHGWSVEEGFAYLEAQKGKHFDPRCVEAFVSATEKIKEIQKQYGDR